MIKIEQIEEASDHTGHCKACGQTIKIYRYGVSVTMAVFLQHMEARFNHDGENDIDISTLGIPYSMRSQNSKLRQHGLIARVKDESGTQVPNHWLITHKGFQFLRGERIAERVVVFNNQVLGHDGGFITIAEALREVPKVSKQAISEPEAKAMNDVRKPTPQTTHTALYIGTNHQDWRRREWEIKVSRLQMGKPVDVLVVEEGDGLVYRDIAAFQKEWKITK